MLRYVFKKPTKIKSITQEAILFDNGYYIYTFHNQECCEFVYADFVGSLQDTGVENVLFQEITFEPVDGYGVKLNERYCISCYNIQNGYYDGRIRFDLYDEHDNIVLSTDFVDTEYLEDYEYEYRKEAIINPVWIRNWRYS